MIRALAFAALPLIVLISCSRPAPPADPPLAERYGAPTPTRALDARADAERPCTVLSEDQLRTLGLEPMGRLDPLPGGPPACVWEDAAFTQQISVALLPTRDYLVDTYRVRAMYQVFEPVTIGGLPAVAQQTSPQALTCTVTTGIAVGQGLDVTASEIGLRPGEPITSCDKAIRTSELVVANLPEQPAK